MGKLDTLIKDFNKQYKEEIAARGIPRIETQRKIPFSSPELIICYMVEYQEEGIIEFAGEENGGKNNNST